MGGANVAHVPDETGTGHKTPTGDAPEPNALAHLFGLFFTSINRAELAITGREESSCSSAPVTGKRMPG